MAESDLNPSLPTPAAAKWRSRFTIVMVATTVIAMFVGFLAGGYIVRTAHAGEGFEYIGRMMKNRDTNPAEHYLDYWYRFLATAAFVSAGVTLFGRALFSPRFFQRCVGPQSPDRLGLIRMIVFGILLISAMWEHLPSTALLPREMFRGVGFVGFVSSLPGFASFLDSSTALAAFQWTTILVLAAAMLGWGTRVTVPLAALLYFLLVGLIRSYCWAYHTGILPLYVAGVLIFTPCGASWSVDAWIRRKRRRGRTAIIAEEPGQKSARYGWACYACWCMVAIAFAAAGLSKLRNGGLGWFEPNNFRSILFATNLTPMEFDFGVALQLSTAPDWVFSFMAVSGMALQLMCLAIPFSPRVRLVLPILIAFMHINIWVLQNILFFDAILIQLIFYDFTTWQAKLRAWAAPRMGMPAAAARLAADPDPQVPPSTPWAWIRSAASQQLLTFAVVALVMTVWLAKFEFYPLTAMQMFSRPSNEAQMPYYKVIAEYSDGSRGRAPIEECIPAFRDSRYRHMLKAAFAKSNGLATDFFEICMEQYNSDPSHSRAIESIEVQRWSWTYTEPPQDGNYGSMIDSRLFTAKAASPVDPEGNQ